MGKYLKQDMDSYRLSIWIFKVQLSLLILLYKLLILWVQVCIHSK